MANKIFEEKTIDKFEQDYWGTSYKELVKKMKSKYTIKEIQNFKIASFLRQYIKRMIGICVSIGPLYSNGRNKGINIGEYVIFISQAFSK